MVNCLWKQREDEIVMLTSLGPSVKRCAARTKFHCPLRASTPEAPICPPLALFVVAFSHCQERLGRSHHRRPWWGAWHEGIPRCLWASANIPVPVMTFLGNVSEPSKRVASILESRNSCLNTDTSFAPEFGTLMDQSSSESARLTRAAYLWDCGRWPLA